MTPTDNKTTHTPGPWETSRDAVPDYHTQITVYAESSGERVATAFITDANARLIAAAPDMLAFLKSYRAWEDQCDCYDMDTDRPHQCHYCKAGEIIDRIEGNA